MGKIVRIYIALYLIWGVSGRSLEVGTAAQTPRFGQAVLGRPQRGW